MNASQRASERWGMRAPLPEGQKTVPTKEELDRRLERYLDAQDEAERQGATISAVKASLQHVVDWTQAHERKDDSRHDESTKRLDALERSNTALLVRFDAMESDIRELKGGTRAALDSIHDITEHDLEQRLSEAKAKHEAHVDFWKKVAVYTVCAVVGVLTTYLAMRLGIAH